MEDDGHRNRSFLREDSLVKLVRIHRNIINYTFYRNITKTDFTSYTFIAEVRGRDVIHVDLVRASNGVDPLQIKIKKHLNSYTFIVRSFLISFSINIILKVRYSST